MIDGTFSVCYFIHMKARTNVSIEKELLDAARTHNIVLSTLLDKAIKDELKKLEEQAWKQKNRAAAEEYNKYISESGVFSDGMRSF